MGQLYASLKTGHVSASVALKLLVGFSVGGRIKTSQWGSNQNQPLFSFKPVRVILARGDLRFSANPTVTNWISTDSKLIEGW